NLRLCSGKLMTPITDDVSKLSSLKQNVPSDYEIPVSSIPKDVAGTCWVVLNIYPLEQSLRNLAGMFGAVSSNREQISVFISMLKSLRFTFNHEELEAAMQLFQCHYRERGLMSGLYFDYIKDILHAASQGTSGLPCKPPPCLNQHPSPGDCSFLFRQLSMIKLFAVVFKHILLSLGLFCHFNQTPLC
uniref:Kit ligand n=1 Tax=Takifugu rubripes TaxID=31033 RepID=A0A674P2T0_TAKRU